ncbi:MAG: hypothetical protein HC831_20895, partial [Chloroflexia bacterium]|nr:hypothetical protein [Chloroflexia bacterium]
ILVCEDQVQLAAGSLQPGETGSWSIDGGILNETFSSTSINNPIVTNLRKGLTTFAWTVSNGLCEDDDRVVATNALPWVDAGSDRTICEDFVMLNGNNPAVDGAVGAWSSASTVVNISNPAFYASQVTDLQEGANLFTWTVSNEHCIVSDDVVITKETINVVAGLPYTEDCADTIILEATIPPQGETGYWAAIEGGGIFDNPTAHNTIARNLNGYNKLRWTVSFNGCLFYDEIDFANLTPTQASTQVDKVTCYNDTRIVANPPDTHLGETGTWVSINNQGQVIESPSSYQTNVNNLPQGGSQYSWTISNDRCSTTDTITITNNTVVADAGNDIIICDSIAQLSANIIFGTGSWSTTDGPLIDNPSSGNTTARNLHFGENHFFWTITNGVCEDTDHLIIRSDLPRNVSAGPDKTICEDNTILAATHPGSGTGLWTVLGGHGVFENATSNLTGVSDLSVGENRFRWTVTMNSCSDFDDVFIYNNQIYTVAGQNQTICNQNHLDLNANQPAPGESGYWTAIGGVGTYFDNSLQYNTTVRNLAQGTTTLTWTLTDGICSNSASTEVINNTPSNAVAEIDKEICTDNTSIAAQDITIGTGLWSIKSGAGVFDNAPIATQLFEILTQE